VSSAQTPAEAVEPFRTQAASSAVLLDIDGTLAPIVRHAADAQVPEVTRGLLIELSRAYGLVACITGRPAGEARRMVALGTLTYIGGHGSEVLAPAGRSPVVDPELAAWTDRVRAFVRGEYGHELQRLRVRSEDKGPITALHWRGAPDEDAAHIALERVAIAASEAGFATHWGRKVLEIRPPVPLSKGVAVERLLRASDCTQAIYVGDDRTDIDAFETLHALQEEGALSQALCVAVVSDEVPAELVELADLTVEGTVGVRQLLEALL
jgi:trehalose 6-phosphate phosphatase